MKCLFVCLSTIDSETTGWISTKLGMQIGYGPGSMIGYVKLTLVNLEGQRNHLSWKLNIYSI